jgi:hypothetical protein
MDNFSELVTIRGDKRLQSQQDQSAQYLKIWSENELCLKTQRLR